MLFWKIYFDFGDSSSDFARKISNAIKLMIFNNVPPISKDHWTVSGMSFVTAKVILREPIAIKTI